MAPRPILASNLVIVVRAPLAGRIAGRDETLAAAGLASHSDSPPSAGQAGKWPAATADAGVSRET
jgi:hypothetical protein